MSYDISKIPKIPLIQKLSNTPKRKYSQEELQQIKEYVLNYAAIDHSFVSNAISVLAYNDMFTEGLVKKLLDYNDEYIAGELATHSNRYKHLFPIERLIAMYEKHQNTRMQKKIIDALYARNALSLKLIKDLYAKTEKESTLNYLIEYGLKTPSKNTISSIYLSYRHKAMHFKVFLNAMLEGKIPVDIDYVKSAISSRKACEEPGKKLLKQYAPDVTIERLVGERRGRGKASYR